MFKALLQLSNFTLGPDATLYTLNTEIHKNSVRKKAPNSVNASKRKHKNPINHYNKQRRVLMAKLTVFSIFPFIVHYFVIVCSSAFLMMPRKDCTS